MELNEVLQKRRITREFSDKEVDYKKIEEIIEAGILAPSSNHLRQWDFVIIDDRTLIDFISKQVNNVATNPKTPENPFEDMCKYAFPRQQSMFKESKYIILPIIKENSLYKTDNMFGLMHFADTWCVIENMFLKATDLELGCAMHVPSNIEQKNILEIVKCKSGYVIPCIIGVGYPSENAYYPKEQEFDKNRIHKNRW